jgi:hypothetical protein
VNGGVKPDYVDEIFQQKITRRRSPEHNAKISAKMAGRDLSDMHRENIAASMAGNQNRRRR